MRVLALLLACTTPVHAETPVELGAVSWTRDLKAPSDKPKLVLFTEVPGCSTVQGFGKGPLQNPLLVEAIETLFTPVLVYNNTPDDASTCASFGEPRWNNPVIRVLDGKGTTTARFEGPYSDAGLASFLVGSLEAPPPWFSGVANDLTASTAEATFQMGCFWSGEAALGAQEGVTATATGFQGGAEVVKVSYDPKRTNAQKLHDSTGYRRVEGGSFRSSPSDDLYHLEHSRWAAVEMTPGQAARANALVARGLDPSVVLSPRQRQ